MYRILLVDDEPNILNAVRRTLQLARPEDFGGRKLAMESFDKPEDALARAREQAFDLVVSDFRMPRMNGVQLLREVASVQPNVARIILSAHTDLEALVGAINEVGIFRFLSKPWHDYELKSAVAQALQTRELQRENQRLADLVRVQRGELSRQDMELRRLEEQFPGLVRRAPRETEPPD
jgi:DNA-binding NtrC family response regulator